MNRNVVRYLFLSVSMLLLSLSIWWLVLHFQKPNLRTVKIEQDLYGEILWQKEKEKAEAPILVENEEEFAVHENERVYLTFRKGGQLAGLIDSGKLTLQNAEGIVFEQDLLADAFSGEIRLAAGKYRLTEKAVINPQYFAKVVWQEGQSIRIGEKKSGGFELYPEQYELVIQIF